MSDSLLPHGLYNPWTSPGQKTGVSSHCLLQGIFPTQGSNPGLPHCGQILYHLSHQASTMLCNRRSHCNKKPRHQSMRVAPAPRSWRKPVSSNEDPMQPKKKKKKNLITKKCKPSSERSASHDSNFKDH